MLPLNLLYFKSCAILMHDVTNHCAPPNISELFIYPNQIHSYRTRSLTAGQFYVQRSILNQQLFSFSRSGVSIWWWLYNYIHLWASSRAQNSKNRSFCRKLAQIKQFLVLFFQLWYLVYTKTIIIIHLKLGVRESGGCLLCQFAAQQKIIHHYSPPLSE